MWDLGLKSNASVADTKKAIVNKIDKVVLNWAFDEKVKEFVKRILDKERNGEAWLESVASHLVGKLPDKWSDDDIPIFIHQLRFMKILYEEAEYLHVKNLVIDHSDKLESLDIEMEFESLAKKLKLSKTEKQLAIIKLYSKYVKSEQKN